MFRLLTLISFCIVLCFLGTGIAMAKESGVKNHEFVTVSPDTSPPDAWGYTWVRSTDPGGPTFNWVDISQVGTEVTGVGDDVNVGPFPIGFQFPYYWYNTSTFRIGSNGYVVLRNDPANWSSPFPAIPTTSPAVPKDVLAILTGDLDPGNLASNPHIYYWSNGVDSLVVSFINVTEWRSPADPNQRHTFQVILNKQDSSIIYQYGRQQGRYNASNNNRLVIGWQNQSGQIGMAYTNTTYPPDHPMMPDSGLAIRIKRTVNTGLSVTDAGIVGGFNSENMAKVVQLGAPDTMKAIVKNFGTVDLTNVRVTYAISRSGQPTARDTVFITSLLASEEITVAFPRLFTPAVVGSYSAAFTAFVPGDQGPGNNTRTAELVSANFVVGQRTLVAYETNVQGTTVSWTGGGGFGVHYELPVPVVVESVYFRVTSATSVVVEILDGTGGVPGEVLATRTVTSIANALTGVSFVADSVFVPNGKFFIGSRGLVAYSMETALPISFRTWEYTNAYAPYRSRDIHDVIMRATVRTVELPPPPPGFFDDFEAYTAGQRLACQNPTDWTTWSLTPCDPTEDAMISTNHAYSGTKSVVIVQNNDVVKRFGSLTTGKHRILFQVYIPTGKAGYFNTMAGFTPNPFSWGMEVYFDAGGGGRLIADATATFSWSANTWQPVEVFVDLDIDSAKFYFNGSMIRSWRWTRGGSIPRRLDANDFYGATANDEMYVDDYHFYEVVLPPAAPQLLQPANGAEIAMDSVVFVWRSTGPAVEAYWFENATDSLFGTSTIDSTLADTTTIMRSLTNGQRYWWRVRARNAGGWGPFSIVRSYRIVLTGLTESENLPKQFSLAQNYPNPFNPSTEIQYALPKAAFVTMKVYSILGQEVATLVSNEQAAGYHVARWDGKNGSGASVSSGMYFYRMEARTKDGGTFVSVKKMLLLK